MTQILSATLLSDVERVIDFDDIGTSYTLIGSLFAFPVRQLLIQNGTDSDLKISINPEHNLTDTMTAFAGKGYVFDFTSNANNSNGLYKPINEGVWVKQLGTPTEGSVYVTVFYAKGSVN